MTSRYLTASVFQELQKQLSDHDILILKSVSDLRFLTGAQLARMHFGSDASSARAMRRALLRLTRLGFLDRLPRAIGGVRAGSAGFVYVLGIAGQKLAFASGWQRRRRGRRSHTPGTLFLAHCLDVAELHVQLVEADRDRRLELLELVAEPDCHRTISGLGNQRVLKPDSFVRFGLQDWEFSYFVEVDRGTYGGGALHTKLREYLRYEASGIEQHSRGVFPKVLWSVPDRARAEVIEAQIEQLPKGGRKLFGVALRDDVVKALISQEEQSN